MQQNNFEIKFNPNPISKNECIMNPDVLNTVTTLKKIQKEYNYKQVEYDYLNKELDCMEISMKRLQQEIQFLSQEYLNFKHKYDNHTIDSLIDLQIDLGEEIATETSAYRRSALENQLSVAQKMYDYKSKGFVLPGIQDL